MTGQDGSVRAFERVWRPEHSVDVAGTLAVHWRGVGDPAHRVMSDGAVWRTCRTADGPATVRVNARPVDGEVAATAWGPGAPNALDALPQWLGADDDPAGFHPNHPLLARAARRHAGLRLSRTALVMEALVPAVLEQKVTGREASRAWRSLLLRFGDPAPGPAPDGMRVVPTPQRWASLPSWEWHRAGVGPNRSGTVVRAARLARQLEDVGESVRSRGGESVADGAGHRRMDRRRGQAASAGRSGCCVCGRLSPAPAGGIRTWPARSAPTTTGCWSCSSRTPDSGYRACLLLALVGSLPPRRAPRLPVRDFRRI